MDLIEVFQCLIIDFCVPNFSICFHLFIVRDLMCTVCESQISY
ncbi:hypothetical protein F383_30095 [Gossypium arboreum]|uniref:Uncharacterized protein n=1 Tax=Gossypium arboreum TaxID=29729 RepID=A0A0B0MX77_GOSAR|nr:hypothetical protein F383_30095 [Gossypium arboreum]